MVEPIKEVLMTRDGLTAEEADERISEVKEQLNELLEDGGSLDQAEEIIEDEFGLEPDYLEELLGQL